MHRAPAMLTLVLYVAGFGCCAHSHFYLVLRYGIGVNGHAIWSLLVIVLETP